MSRVDELMLLSVWNLQDQAYAVAIQNHLFKLTNEKWSFGSIYVSLDRLTTRELVLSELGSPTPERGGRAKRLYTLTSQGRQSLLAIRQLQNEIWSSVSIQSLETGIAK